VSGQRSSLQVAQFHTWWRRWDSNPGPPTCKALRGVHGGACESAGVQVTRGTATAPVRLRHAAVGTVRGVDAGCHLVAPPPARRWTDSTGWTSYSTQKSTYASPTTARPTSDAITATEVIRFACLSSHSSPSDTSGCRATARRRSPTIPRNRHPKRVATPKNTSTGTVSRPPQPAELLASSSHGFARSRVDDNARVEFHPAAPERRVPESPPAHRVASKGRATVPHVPFRA